MFGTLFRAAMTIRSPRTVRRSGPTMNCMQRITQFLLRCEVINAVQHCCNAEWLFEISLMMSCPEPLIAAVVSCGKVRIAGSERSDNRS